MLHQDRIARRRPGVGRLVCALAVVAPLVGDAIAAKAEPVEATVEIAPVETALTFARTGGEADRRLLAVTEYRDGIVAAVDVSRALGRPVRDPIAVFYGEGYDGLAKLVSTAPADTRVSLPVSELAVPVDLADRHIAAGTNYPIHADEADVEDGPFLFAKLVRPTPARSTVRHRGGLLDYEAELGWVTLEPVDPGSVPSSMPEWMGVILCNDYTDRETLMLHIDPWDPASGVGFATGKSFEGYLPVGDLFVIPRDYRAFARERELTLWVDGELRQQAQVSQAVWQIDDLVSEIGARRDLRWDHRGASVGLLAASGPIPARTILLGGTPGGTIFQGPDTNQKLRGAAAWLLGGWGRPLAAHVIDATINDAHLADIYLKSGSRVQVRVDGLGMIDNTIAD